MRLYIVRHADPIYETNTITEEGVREAEALAEYLVDEEHITHLYSSTQGRAIDTALPTARKMGSENWSEHRDYFSELKLEKLEMFEPFAPKGRIAVWDIPAELSRNLNCLNEEEKKLVENVVAQGKSAKSLAELPERSNEFLKEFGLEWDSSRRAYRVEKPNEFKVAVVCHNGFGLSWIAHLLDAPLEMVWNHFWLAPSSVTTILFEQRSAQFAVPRILQLGSTAHLYKAGLQIPNSKYEDGERPSGIKANFF